MEENTKVSCFLPVYNEAEVINKNVIETYNYISKLFKNYEVFVIDDASTDGSMDKLIPLLSEYQNLYLIHYTEGPSKRENLACSFNNALGNIIVFIDSDLEARLDTLDLLISEIKNGADIAIGSRYIKESFYTRKLWRLLISKVYNIAIRYIFNTNIRDHQCGFKAFKLEIVLNLIEDMGYDRTYKRGWFWDAELLIRALRKKLKIIEIPVNWYDRKSRSFSIRENLSILPFIFKLKKEKQTGEKYKPSFNIYEAKL
ncbi:MAG: glycosyltransferase [Candidatus Firestonebacteria bacterium]|nr:glycosyltransferase [Candidatus Firestonebacteria bacterium]